LGDSQERHHDPDQDQSDSLRPLAHRFPPFRFRLDTFRVLLSPAGGGATFSNAAMMSRSSAGTWGTVARARAWICPLLSAFRAYRAATDFRGALSTITALLTPITRRRRRRNRS
jgi:hypothetical protein